MYSFDAPIICLLYVYRCGNFNTVALFNFFFTLVQCVNILFYVGCLFFQIYVIDSADKKRFEETGLVSVLHRSELCIQSQADTCTPSQTEINSVLC